MTTLARMPVLAVSAVVLRADGQVLLVTRHQPPHTQVWTLPGGKVHFGERLRTAAAREVREETGVEVEIGAQVAVTEVMTPPSPDALDVATGTNSSTAQYHYVIVTFLARPRDTHEPFAQSDAAAAAFFASEACLALATTPGLGEVLARAREFARTETWAGHE